ncbi:MAG: hypothetical protein WA989_01800 [Henriciella sp.]|uniref:hypothetical protein n=1 Tax=Henriciella sp. TaxID=1968823 RepID=UPI003C747362
MKLFSRLAVGAIPAVFLAACGSGEDNDIRFEYSGTMMDICAETSIGFHPDSADLTGTAESILFDIVDQVGVDCDGASIDIEAFENEEGQEIANARAQAIETAITSNYDISDSRISKSVVEAPTPDQAGRVLVSLMVEVPLEE